MCFWMLVGAVKQYNTPMYHVYKCVLAVCHFLHQLHHILLSASGTTVLSDIAFLCNHVKKKNKLEKNTI